MTWYHSAQKESSLEEKIKEFFKTDPFCLFLRAKYNVPEEKIDSELKIEKKELGRVFSKTNAYKMVIDEDLISSGRILTDSRHVLVHEFNHWLHRQSEAAFYFNDDEEIEGFTIGMAYEMSRGRPTSDILGDYYPIIANHFSNKALAKKFFTRMVRNAVKWKEKFELKNNAIC